LDDGEDRDSETRERDRERPHEPSEGVRIIGAEEAAEALERGDVAPRRAAGQPRFGDRPTSPPTDGPRPALRFPLGSASDPTDIERPPVAPVDSGEPDLPHWTEPATGEVPAVLRGDDDEDAGDDAWGSFAGSPRWRDSASRHEDDVDDLSSLGGDDTRIGALDESDRPRTEDWFSFADIEPQGGRSVFSDVDDDALDEQWAEPEEPEPMAVPRPAPRRSSQHAGPSHGARGGDRDIRQAVIVGVAFGAIALGLFSQGPAWAMLLVVPCITLAAVEMFSALRQAGYQPVTLVGLAATVGLALGAYHRGEAAIPVVLVLTVVTCLLWYLFGAGGENPTLNIGATLLAVGWVGVLGSFAALLLAAPHGVGLLLGAAVGTVGYDVGGLFVGRNAGRQPLSTVSPNKTVEGLIGGCIVAFVVSLLYGTQVMPFDGLGNGIKLGIVIAIAAPLGDLCESLIKRDLGVKDMGSLLPGHGGFFDRFDALLFVLPSVYYLARASDFFA
jgi:phosphatidate cytidylyltransferase